MPIAGTPQKYFRVRAIGPPNLSRTSSVTNRAPARGGFQQLPGCRAAGRRFHHSLTGCDYSNATGHRQSTQGDEEDDPKKNSEKENLGARLPGTHREEKSRSETKRDNESDS
jgi:hypothetical protein